MKRLFFIFILLFTVTTLLFSGVVITRFEMGVETKELYYNNRFAELHNDRIVMMWDFNTFELTLINHPLRIYTTIDYESFKEISHRENLEDIKNEIDMLGEERISMMQSATVQLFRRLRPRHVLADSMMINGFMTNEYHVFNGDIIIQRLWISRALQERINLEIPREKMAQVENIFRDNRGNFLFVMGITMDPISMLVEQLENRGYIMQRMDFGLRERVDEERDRLIEQLNNTITDISIVNIDPLIFTYHQRIYQRLEYDVFQMRMLQEMGRE